MLIEREFNMNEFLNYKKWLKNECDYLWLFERVVKILEEKIEERFGYKRKILWDEIRNLSLEYYRRNYVK